MTAAATVERVKDALTSMGVQFRVDGVSKTVSATRMTPGQVTILTSSAAILEYEPCHPERIDCIVLKRRGKVVNFRAIVNNREEDLVKSLRFWWTTNDPRLSGHLRDGMECAACKQKMSRECVICIACYGAMCVQCHSEASQNSCHRCPSCRAWKLDGDDFGVPWNAGEHVPMKARWRRRDPIDVFCDVLDSLDGRIVVIPRVDKVIIYRSAMETVKFARTNRYAEGSARVEDIRARLKKLCASYLGRTSHVMLYIVRNTFRIDRVADKPVREISAFRVTKSRLYQYSTDAWANMLYKKSDNFVMVKTEYIAPHVFELPAYVQQLLVDVNKSYANLAKTISFASRSRAQMNFDVDASGVEATIHPDMIGAFFSVIASSAGPMYAMFRIHCDDARQTSVVVVYELDHAAAKATELAIADAVKVLQLDLDGCGGCGKRVT